MNTADKLKTFSHPEVDIEINADLSSKNTLRLRASAMLATCSSINGCSELLVFLNEEKIEYRLLGWGANQIIYNSPKWIYISLNFPFKKKYLDSFRSNYTLPANTSLSQLTSTAKSLGLKGWEVFTGIPATIGGAIAMNAGTRLGEFGDLVSSVKVMDVKGELRDELIGENSFKYRGNNFLKPGEVVISAVITHNGQDNLIEKVITDYLKLRNSSQPISKKTCGCVFKNYSIELPAGLAIDLLGMKNFEYKGLNVSPKHCNFIENNNNAASESFLELSSFIKELLERYYGFEFELEVKI